MSTRDVRGLFAEISDAREAAIAGVLAAVPAGFPGTLADSIAEGPLQRIEKLAGASAK